MKQALETADTNKLISDLDAALADTETSFSYAGSSRTMKGLLDGWFAAMDDVADEAALESFMSAAEPQLDDIADVYVAALEAADKAAADAAMATAQDAIGKVNLETQTVTNSAKSAFEAAIEAAIKATINDENATFEVTNWGDLNVDSLAADNGNLTVSGVVIRIGYAWTTTTMGRTLQPIVVPYQL